MGLFDRFKSKKEPTRRGKRSFIAAKINRLNNQFVNDEPPIDYDLHTQGRILISRARFLAKNNEFVRRYLRVVRNNVLGNKGVRMQGRILRNKQIDALANEALESAWVNWGKRGSPEITGSLSWIGLQKIVVDSVSRDGEVFIEKTYGQNAEGLSLKVVDPLLIPFELNKKLNNGNTIVMGVELTPNRRPVAYYKSVPRDFSPSVYSINGHRVVRVSADDMIHIRNFEFVDQTRGFTPLAGAIHKLNMLQRFDEATLVAARVAASQMLFYIDGEDGGQYVGDEDDDAEGPYEYAEDVEPGIARRLPHGADVKMFDPKQPTTQYSDFAKWTLRSIASALNVSYHTLAQDMESVNFSSSRTATLEDREEWKGVQEWMIEEFHTPVYEAWLMPALLAGEIKIKGQAIRPERYNDFLRVAWQGRRWPWVDPLKDMQAAQLAAGLGVRSISSIIRDDGGDPDEVFREISTERETMGALGIEPAFQNKVITNEKVDNA